MVLWHRGTTEESTATSQCAPLPALRAPLHVAKEQLKEGTGNGARPREQGRTEAWPAWPWAAEEAGQEGEWVRPSGSAAHRAGEGPG